jgi:hypothetical protein
MILPEDILELIDRKPEELFQRLKEEEPYLYMLITQTMDNLKDQVMGVENLGSLLGLITAIYTLTKEAQ